MCQGLGFMLALSVLWPVALGVYLRYNAGVWGEARRLQQGTVMQNAMVFCALSIVGWWRLDTRRRLSYKSTVTQNGIAKGLLWAFCVLTTS